RFRQGPVVLAQQALFQQEEVSIFTLGPTAAHVNVDGAVSHLDGECVQVIASSGETAAALHVVAPPMPVTGQDAIADAPARQRISHVRTLIIGRVNTTLVLK